MKKKKKQQDKKQNFSSPSTKRTGSRSTNIQAPTNSSETQEQKRHKSPLAEADKIVNHRRDERDREYGGFSKGMIKTAKIATELCNKEITPDDAYKILMALKLSRFSHSPKFDSFVDLIGYAEGWYNYIQEEQNMDVIQAVRKQLGI